MLAAHPYTVLTSTHQLSSFLCSGKNNRTAISIRAVHFSIKASILIVPHVQRVEKKQKI